MAAKVPDQVLVLARQIVDGMVHPYKGAAGIWAYLAEQDSEYPEGLRVFVGLASEWQDQPGHREEYEQDIRDEAATLIETHGRN